MTGDTRKRSLGLAAVLVLGTVAGFLVAAGTSGADYATVDTVGSDSQAFAMPIEQEDQRVRFTLQADDATVTEPSASFALYDPADEFFTQFDLSGDGDEAEAILGESGPWVLFLTDRQNAQIAVQYEGADDESESVELSEVPVQEERTAIAEQDGGALDEQVALRLDQRPAATFLEYSGNIQSLDAQIASEEGPVYGLTDASANTTEDGTQRDGDATVRSENLVAGTFEVTATADSFDGKLVFVHETYEREQVVEQEPEQPEKQVETEQPVDDEATLVAEIGEHEARSIDTAGAQEIVFKLDRRESADLMIYNSSDRLVNQVEIEDDHEHHEWWDDDNRSEANRTDANHTVTVVELPASGEFAVFASYVSDDDAAVQAIVPTEDAPEADQIEVETTETEIEGFEGSWNTTLPGALLEVDAHSRDAVSTERNVTVSSELGPVLHYEEHFNTFGASFYHEHAEHPERFTDGPITVETDGEGFQGSTTLKLVHLAE